jgi:DNA-binding Xre family transcriptional regulator
MLKLKLNEVLIAHGKKYPQSWLQKTCNLTRSKTQNLLTLNQKSIAFDDLSKICKELNCTPNDLFWWDNSSKKSALPEWHECLTKLKKPSNDSNWISRIETLDLEDIEELKKSMEKFEKQKIEKIMKQQGDNTNEDIS